jgi:hypothetical protein
MVDRSLFIVGMAPKINVFLLIQPLKSQKTNLRYQLKKKYPPLAKNLPRIRFSCHAVFYHFCDMSLITACAIFCSVKFHVVCTFTFFRGGPLEK